MLKKVMMALLILFTAFLQCSVFQIFEIASIKPNLLIIVTVAFALMNGRKFGLWTGFFSGLCLDIMFPGNFGFQTLIYMWVGYLAGYAFRIFYDDDIKTPIVLVTIADLGYGMYEYIFSFLLRGRINFPFYLSRIIIPELLYTLIMTIVTYRLLYRINKRLGSSEKRSIDSLV